MASTEEIQAWKDASHDEYTRKAQSRASIAQGENATSNSRDNAMLQEDMGPHWTHPFLGPKAFFDKFVRVQLNFEQSTILVVHLSLSTLFLLQCSVLLMK